VYSLLLYCALQPPELPSFPTRRSSDLKLVSAMQDRDLRRELREEDCLLHGGVAAADDYDFLVAVERGVADGAVGDAATVQGALRSEEHTSELQSRGHLVCRLLLEKKKT